jgi:uncharacterized protein
MMTSPMPAQLALLVSPAAPKAALSPLELDGYLTGVIITPRATPIPPSQWVAGLWGDEEPFIDDGAQINLVLRALIDRYNELVREIDRSLERLETDRVCDYRPMFMPSEGKPAHDTVRRWARGFDKAMTLGPGTWSALAQDKRAKTLLTPFVGFFDLDDLGPIEIPDDLDAILDESAAAIPRTILVLHKLTKMRRRSSSPARQGKVGRNDPCPCGSGQKYKRCCGQN